jgi:hypothetical protein
VAPVAQARLPDITPPVRAHSEQDLVQFSSLFHYEIATKRQRRLAALARCRCRNIADASTFWQEVKNA